MYLVRTSVDSKELAKEIALEVVESRAAASAHIREIESVFAWEGKVEDTTEWEIECITDNPRRVSDIMHCMHSYEMPEMIATEIGCSNEMGQWIIGWCE